MPADSTTQASWSQQLAQLCDERDLYRALLVADPVQLRQFLRQGHAHLESVQALLQQPARGSVEFRTKLAMLANELTHLGALCTPLDLPSFQRRLEPLLERLEALRALPDATGDDLLPVLEMIDDLYCHLICASDVRPRTPPARIEAEDARTPEAPDEKLSLALAHLAERIAAEQGREIELISHGLGQIPESLRSSLFDMMSQLVRNAVEHGIEPPKERLELAKPRAGSLQIDFAAVPGGSRLSVRDDGRGLDSIGLHAVAVKRGLIEESAHDHVSPRQVARLIFAPGITTSSDPARTGIGLQSVREAVRRLGGRIEFSTKLGHFTRFDILLPNTA